MTSFEEAQDMILSNVAPLESERLELTHSLGRVTAEDAIAPLNLPSFNNSAMDGYAVRVTDCNSFVLLAIRGNIPAGAVASCTMGPGSAIKIMTGAPVPHGCDAIVPLEDADEAGQEIWIKAAIIPGQHIRYAGEDVKLGTTVLAAGTLLRVPEISMLASLGQRVVQVYRKPLVAILATGDELVEPGQPLPEGMVFNSNSSALAAAVVEAGATPVIIGVARDDREHLRQKIAEGLLADALITVAGASVGDRDFVREILAELGVTQLFWQVSIKPGKSTAFGVKDGRPVFSLPGNPVSAIVTFEELVRPALLKMTGRKQVVKPLLRAILQEDVPKKQGKTYFARVKLRIVDGKILAWSSGHQDTGFLQTMIKANGIAILPPDRASLTAGDEIDVHFLSNEWHVEPF